jgi:MoaA/NifB/PqqE/SkfB family radical SAM enzyme
MQPDAYQKILQKTFERKIPFNAQIELTYRCNLSCVHCYATNRNLADELSTAEVENVLQQLADLGCLFLSLTGGEIFCRNDAIQIMQ